MLCNLNYGPNQLGCALNSTKIRIMELKHDLINIFFIIYNTSPVKRGCPVDSVNRNKAHWDLIMNRKACMEAIKAYKFDKEYICSLCGKRFKDRRSRRNA